MDVRRSIGVIALLKDTLPDNIHRLFKKYGPCKIIRIERQSDVKFHQIKKRWLPRFQGRAQAVLKTEKEEFVLVKQYSIRDDRMLWTFPGGGVAKNESFENCVIRETKEEIGLDIIVTGLNRVFQNIEKSSGGEELEWWLVVFDGKILSGQMKPRSSEILESKTFQELPSNFMYRKHYEDLDNPC